MHITVRGKGSSKYDFILKGALTKHLGGRGSQKGPKSSDVVYGRPLILFESILGTF